MVEKNRKIVNKILTHAEKILSYCATVNEEDFLADNKLIEACVFNLIQIGELTRLLDEDYMARYSNVPWHQMRGLRNRIVHDYKGVDLHLIWDIVSSDVKNLVQELLEGAEE